MVLVGNRATSSTSVGIGPVIAGPIPERSITLVPRGLHQGGDLEAARLDLAVDGLDVGQMLGGQLVRGGVDEWATRPQSG